MAIAKHKIVRRSKDGAMFETIMPGTEFEPHDEEQGQQLSKQGAVFSSREEQRAHEMARDGMPRPINSAPGISSAPVPVNQTQEALRQHAIAMGLQPKGENFDTQQALRSGRLGPSDPNAPADDRRATPAGAYFDPNTDPARAPAKVMPDNQAQMDQRNEAQQKSVDEAKAKAEEQRQADEEARQAQEDAANEAQGEDPRQRARRRRDET